MPALGVIPTLGKTGLPGYLATPVRREVSAVVKSPTGATWEENTSLKVQQDLRPRKGDEEGQSPQSAIVSFRGRRSEVRKTSLNTLKMQGYRGGSEVKTLA